MPSQRPLAVMPTLQRLLLPLLALAIPALAIPALARPVAAQRPDTAYARITYLSGASAYVDAGANDGLADGAELDVRRGRVIGTLRARFLSPSRAQCEIVAGADVIAIGDTVRFVRTAPRLAHADTAAVLPVAPQRVNRRPDRSLRGRVGARYLGTWQRDSGSGSLAQPSYDLRLDGPVPGLPTLGVTVDARGHRTRTVAIDGVVTQSHTSTLVYQASLAWRPTSAVRVQLGRQYAGELASVSLFDGVLAALERPRFAVGAFAGTQPDLEMAYSTDTREYGLYVSARNADAPDNAWTLTTGAIGSYFSGQLDREFVFVSGALNASRLSLYGVQEVDYNRGWKRAFGGSALSPTSTYLSARVRLTDAVSLQSGYDTRRNVRLYRNYVTPDIAFDDAFRSGVWGGLLATLGPATTLSLDARRSSGGTSAAADIFSLSASTRRQIRWPLEFRGRSSRYDSPAATGWLQTLSAAITPNQVLRLEATGGARLETPASGTAAAATATRVNVGWVELNADVSLGRSWYLLLSGTRERGGWDSSDQIYSSLSYRF